MDDEALAEPSWYDPSGSTGDDPAMAPRWISNVLALEVAQ
jgi:hypothetical protein